MKKTIIVIVLSFLGLAGIRAQEKNLLIPDSRLYEAFDAAFVNKMAAENQNLLLYYNLFLDSSFFVMEIPEEKINVAEEYDPLPIPDTLEINEINILKYDIRLDFDKRTMYRWGESCKVIVFRKGDEFTAMYNKQRKLYGLLRSENQAIMKTYTYIIPFIILILFSTNKLFSQTYEIDAQNGQTISTCSGTFYDSGGQFGNYNSGENYSVTFCPSTTGTYIELGFSVWDVSPGASLQVFDGPDNTYNNFGTFSAGGFDPTTMGVVASPTNTSGCLTVQWTSGSGSDVGWEAVVSCVIPCQIVQSTLLSSNPPVNADGFIDICPGETVQFIGGGLYPENNLVYNQSNFTSSYYWNFGNGVVDSTSNIVNVLYDSISGYNVSLVVTDTMGCFSTNTLDVRVRVSTAPTFSGTIPEDSVICSGDNVTLFGEVQTTPF